MARGRIASQTQSKLAMILFGEEGTGKSSLALQLSYFKRPDGKPFRILYIDNENGFLIESDNTQALANKIKEISSLSGEELFNIRKKAQEDVKDISSVEKTMSVFLDTLNKWDYE